MQDTIKLSIIIPVYGVEEYIQKFLDSLLPQMNANVELVFIDDGCKDRSMEIVSLELSKLESNLQKRNNIITQENQGVSTARNTGLREAKGLYITFLDPDDYVMNNYISSILNAIENYSFDIMHFNMKHIRKNNTEKSIIHVNDTKLVKIDNNYLNNLFSLNRWFVPMRVFHRDLIMKFNFPVGFVFEDMLSFPFLYKNGLYLYELNEELIVYQYRDGSITNNGITRKIVDSMEYGIALFRERRTEAHFKHTYLKFIMYAFKRKIQLGRVEYFNFINNIEETDLLFFRKNLEGLHWKQKFMIKYPRTFFFYTNKFKHSPMVKI